MTAIANPDWNAIETVLVDMDGTLLDLHFDNHFWLEHVPVRYAEHRGISVLAARAELKRRYRDVEGTMNWYCLDYWSEQLDMDIVELKREVDHLIQILPGVPAFLDALRSSGRRTVLVTNAHQGSLALKLEKTRLGDHLDQLICAHDLGLTKEEPGFWGRLKAEVDYEGASTILFDDNLDVLRSARQGGIAQLMSIYQPDSKKPPRDVAEFGAVARFDDLIPDLRAAGWN